MIRINSPLHTGGYGHVTGKYILVVNAVTSVRCVRSLPNSCPINVNRACNQSQIDDSLSLKVQTAHRWCLHKLFVKPCNSPIYCTTQMKWLDFLIQKICMVRF